tara:strand:- start:271 stop:537 length:267 start_codon:yes stop_codon:yes gene_type:complete
MSKVNKGFFLKQTVSELDNLSEKESQLVLGVAKLSIYVHKAGDTAEETIQKFYPQMRPHLKEKVAMALELLLDLVEPELKSPPKTPVG